MSAWKSKPGGGMGPGPGGDRPTTYDIFVGNLSEEADEGEVQGLFEKYGEILSTTVLSGKRGDGRQIAFVRFANESDAVLACQESSNLVLDGVSLNVRRALKKAGGTQSGGGAVAGGGDGFSRKTDRRQPSSGQGGASFDYQSNTMEKTDQAIPRLFRDRGKSLALAMNPIILHNDGFNSKPRSSGFGNNPHPPTVAVPIREEKVMVTHIESPTCFWGQAVETQIELLQITENLVAVCPSAVTLTGQPHLDKIYATKFSEDQDWYRCRVLKYNNETTSDVQYLDYGNGEAVQNATIVELPPSVANIRPQASKYVLFGLKPYCHDSGSIGHGQGMKKFGELTTGKLLTAKVYFGAKMGPIPVILEDGDVDINQEMLNAGFGEKRFTAQQPSFGSGKPAGGYPGVGKRTPDSSWTTQPIGTFNEKDVARESPEPFRATVAPPGRGDPNVGQLQGELQKTKRDLYEVQCRLREQVTGATELLLCQREKNAFIMELATTRGRLKMMEQDYAEVTVKLHESNLHYKMTNLLAAVNQVKQLRRQFPMDSRKPDNIQRAIDLVSSTDDRISLTSLGVIAELEGVMTSYNVAQDDIRACTDLELLPDLVATRDTCRVEVYNKIVEFLDAIHSLPLETRAAQLKDTVSYMEATHATFLQAHIVNLLSLEVALEAYQVWKAKKEVEFQDVRTETNTRHNSVVSALRLVQQQLSLEVVSSPDSPPAATANLDQLLARLQAAMMKEIERTDIEHDCEAGFIAIVLQTLVAQVKCELADIQQLETLRVEYLGVQMQLGHWLTERPSIVELRVVRQTIKGLKSRLRHTLADKQDAEESDENEELTTINSELTKIRSELQAAFTQEGELLSEIAELNERHFPELTIQYPELNIDNEVKNGGLLKLSHTLDQYDVEPLPGCSKKSIMRTSHCGKPVIIKEYILGEGGKQKMGEFMRRAVAYNSVVNEHLTPLQDIFFGKNERHAYVRLPYYARSLSSLVEERQQLTDKEIYRVLVGVLKGLRALHDMRLVHGVLHPNNVFLDDNNSACLSEFDFTKTLNQRAEHTFTTQTGLVFSAPEGAANCSRCSDMFNFGLLMLWLYFPGVQFNVNNKGIPDIPCVTMPISASVDRLQREELSTIIYNLRRENPLERFTAFDLLNDPFFMTPPETLPRPVANPEEDILQLRPRSDASPTDRDRSNAGGILKNGTASSEVSDYAKDTAIHQVELLMMSADEELAIVSLQPDGVVPELEENETVVNDDNCDIADRGGDCDLGGHDDDDCDVAARGGDDCDVTARDDGHCDVATHDDDNCDVAAPNGDSMDDESVTSGLQLDIPMISIHPATPILLSPARSPLTPVSPPSPCDSDEIIGVATNGDATSDAEEPATPIECTDEPADGDAKQVAKKLIQAYEELPVDP